ncbi:MAG: hypothetical protein AB7F76_14355, partial [Parvibaculaceae bacterium]
DLDLAVEAGAAGGSAVDEGREEGLDLGHGVAMPWPEQKRNCRDAEAMTFSSSSGSVAYLFRRMA